MEVHAELFNLLAQAASLINLAVVDLPSSKMPSLVPVSAAAFFSAEDIVVFSLLNSLNFFTLFCIAFLTIGVSTQSGMSRMKSLLVVLLTFSCYLMFNIGTIKFLRDALHLLI